MDNKYNIYITGRPNEGDELIAENVKSFYIPFFVKEVLNAFGDSKLWAISITPSPTINR